MGLIEQISSGAPSTLRAVRRRPSPPDLSSLSIAVLQRSLFLGITRLGPVISPHLPRSHRNSRKVVSVGPSAS